MTFAKLSIAVISFGCTFISASAFAGPRVAASFININPVLCDSKANMASACQISMGTTQNFKKRMSGLDQSSAEYARFATLLSHLEAAQEINCEPVKEDQNVLMATATVTLDAPVTISTAKLDQGVLGRVEFGAGTAASVRMNVYGDMFCQALIKARGNGDAALEAIAAEVLAP